ncbi:hypothetical protein EMCRGX_G020201 [Ephydatia muelleri]
MCLLLAGLQASPIPITEEQKRINDRHRQLTDQNAVEYMRKLHSSMTDEDGALLNLETNPTSVWCLLNKDLSTTRPVTPNNEWTSTFVFSLPNDTPPGSRSDVMRAILRSYLQVTPVPGTPAARAAVNVTVFAKLSDREPFAAAQSTLEVGPSGWIELDVTEGLKRMWVSTSSLAELTVTLAMVNGTVATIALADSVSLAEGAGYAQFQPLLIIHLSDKKLRQKLIESTAESNELTETRSKRTSDYYPEACRIHNYTILFSDIGLSNILVPYSYNARKCTGLCSSPYFKGVDDVNNYAVMVNSAKAAYNALRPAVAAALSDEYVPPPTAPCCVPTRYSSLTTLMQNLDGSVKVETLSDMQVLACGCR